MEALLDRPPDFAPPPGRGALYTAEAAAEQRPPYETGPVLKSSVEGDPVRGADHVPVTGDNSVKLVGRLFGLFILVERGDRLFIIDQHAAHERLLYNRFLSQAVPRQELLVPIPFNTAGEEDDLFLTGRREDLARLGIVIEGEEGAWHIAALPVNWKLSDTETIRELLDLRNAGENIAERWAATLACHGAIKDGDYLDDTTALALAAETLALPVPRCPHGRPVWSILSREELFRAVQRT
jgi:DNA mismatch repair protein MutL